jgi:hypothetical protein
MDADTPPGAIGPWLESLGLGRYREVFIAQEIDLQILPDLTEAELASLGIPLGPRKKILKAVRALRGGTVTRNRSNGAGGVDPETSSSPRRWPVLTQVGLGALDGHPIDARATLVATGRPTGSPAAARGYALVL